MEARRRVKLTGTNRSFDLIALIAKARMSRKNSDDRTNRGRMNTSPDSPVRLGLRKNQFCFIQTTDIRGSRSEHPSSDPPSSVLRLPFFAGLVALAR